MNPFVDQKRQNRNLQQTVKTLMKCRSMLMMQ